MMLIQSATFATFRLDFRGIGSMHDLQAGSTPGLRWYKRWHGAGANGDTTDDHCPLSNTQLFILSHAAQHSEGRVLPLPKGIDNKGGAATRVLKSLLRRQYVEESIAHREDQEWSRTESGERLTLNITPAGLAAIGVSEAPKQVDDPAKRPVAAVLFQHPELRSRTL